MPINPDSPLDPISPKESSKATQALLDYAHMGVARSLRKLHERYQEQHALFLTWKGDRKAWPPDRPIPLDVPSVRWETLGNWSSGYAWVDRVTRYDELKRQEEQKEFEADRIFMRRQRIDLLKGAFSKTVLALSKFDPGKATTKVTTFELINLMRTVVQELRKELGDERASVLFEIDYLDPTLPMNVLEMIASGTATEQEIRTAIRESQSRASDTE